jgi:hypothetical protein
MVAALIAIMAQTTRASLFGRLAMPIKLAFGNQK